MLAEQGRRKGAAPRAAGMMGKGQSGGTTMALSAAQSSMHKYKYLMHGRWRVSECAHAGKYA